MPWQGDGYTFFFKGNIAKWVRIFQNWYKEDIPVPNSSTDFSTYLKALILIYADKAQKKWKYRLFGKGNVRKVESYLSDKTIYIPSQRPLLDLLNYLAEHIEEKDFVKWAQECRKRATHDSAEMFVDMKIEEMHYGELFDKVSRSDVRDYYRKEYSNMPSRFSVPNIIYEE